MFSVIDGGKKVYVEKSDGDGLPMVEFNVRNEKCLSWAEIDEENIVGRLFASFSLALKDMSEEGDIPETLIFTTDALETEDYYAACVRILRHYFGSAELVLDPCPKPNLRVIKGGKQ